ncbi:MAG: FAD-dependent oxidoreductase, partial [Kiritimatiellota bacterium]|nr:FAD-dependent oxidoreductase [Kiritimatiellota bacterium]
MSQFREITHNVDFCVVGGGMAGLCAALAAARRGVRVVLMHDRPVLGGNASSECRVHISGADVHNHFKNMRETGILEEIRLANLYCNPNRNFSIWD